MVLKTQGFFIDLKKLYDLKSRNFGVLQIFKENSIVLASCRPVLQQRDLPLKIDGLFVLANISDVTSARRQMFNKSYPKDSAVSVNLNGPNV